MNTNGFDMGNLKDLGLTLNLYSYVVYFNLKFTCK